MVAMNTQKIYGGKKSNALSENKYNASCMWVYVCLFPLWGKTCRK